MTQPVGSMNNATTTRSDLKNTVFGSNSVYGTPAEHHETPFLESSFGGSKPVRNKGPSGNRWFRNHGTGHRRNAGRASACLGLARGTCFAGRFGRVTSLRRGHKSFDSISSYNLQRSLQLGSFLGVPGSDCWQHGECHLFLRFNAVKIKRVAPRVAPW